MKKATARLCVLAGFLLFANTVEAPTNLVDTVLAQAKFQGEMSYAKAELRKALVISTLVVKASVVNSNATVMASTNQHEVSTGQGWRVVGIRPEAVLHGKWDKGDIFMGSDWMPDVVYGSGIQFPPRGRLTNGERCFFFLKPDEKLSRWCMTNVFREVKSVPVK